MTITFNPKLPQIGSFTAGLSVDAFKLTLKQINNIVACICTPSMVEYILWGCDDNAVFPFYKICQRCVNLENKLDCEPPKFLSVREQKME